MRPALTRLEQSSIISVLPPEVLRELQAAYRSYMHGRWSRLRNRPLPEKCWSEISVRVYSLLVAGPLERAPHSGGRARDSVREGSRSSSAPWGGAANEFVDDLFSYMYDDHERFSAPSLQPDVVLAGLGAARDSRFSDYATTALAHTTCIKYVKSLGSTYFLLAMPLYD